MLIGFGYTDEPTPFLVVTLNEADRRRIVDGAVLRQPTYHSQSISGVALLASEDVTAVEWLTRACEIHGAKVDGDINVDVDINVGVETVVQSREQLLGVDERSMTIVAEARKLSVAALEELVMELALLWREKKRGPVEPEPVAALDASEGARPCE